MKTIIFNDDNLTDNDINNVVKRAKVLIENNKKEFLIANSYKNYHLIGGHVEDKETDFECIKREPLEETGILLTNEKFIPIMQIIYYNKNYPETGIDSKYIANYYWTITDKKIRADLTNLTDEELDGKFKCVFIKNTEILDVLKKSMDNCTRKNVVRDTYLAVEEYIKTKEKDE